MTVSESCYKRDLPTIDFDAVFTETCVSQSKLAACVEHLLRKQSFEQLRAGMNYLLQQVRIDLVVKGDSPNHVTVCVLLLEYMKRHSNPTMLCRLASCLSTTRARSLRRALKSTYAQSMTTVDTFTEISRQVQTLLTIELGYKWKSLLMFLEFLQGNSSQAQSPATIHSSANANASMYCAGGSSISSSNISSVMFFKYVAASGEDEDEETRGGGGASFRRDVIFTRTLEERYQLIAAHCRANKSLARSRTRQRVFSVNVCRNAVYQSILDAMLLGDGASDCIHLPLQLRFGADSTEAVVFDAGGVQIEMFRLFFDDACRRLFEYNEDADCYLPLPLSLPPHSDSSRDVLREFFGIGRVMGVALQHKMGVGIKVPAFVYGFLTGQFVPDVSREFAVLHPAMHKSMHATLDAIERGQLSHAAFQDTFPELRFEYDRKCCQQQMRTLPLDASRQHPPESVDLHNFARYVAQVEAHWVLPENNASLVALIHGVWSVVNNRALHIVRPTELRTLCVGQDGIDMARVLSQARYEGFDIASNQAHAQFIDDFWDIILDWDVDRQRAFLCFVTCKSTVPPAEVGGVVITIHHAGAVHADRLPTAHTCANTILLPLYPTRDILRQRLEVVLHHSEGFGFT